MAVGENASCEYNMMTGAAALRIAGSASERVGALGIA
jgi:hypothetical protein